MARVIAFEGRHIQVPDDATDDEIAEIIGGASAAPVASAAAPSADPHDAGMAGIRRSVQAAEAARMGAAPATSAPPGRTWGDVAADVGAGAVDKVGQFARGTRRGLAGLFGLPVDAVSAGMRLAGVPVGDTPFMGSNFIDQATGGFGAVPEPVVDSAADRAFQRVGQEIGGAAVPVGASLLAAGRLGLEGARRLPALARMFVEPAAINPVKFAQKEAVVASAAGTGAAGVNEATRAAGVKEGSVGHSVGDIAGALAGAGGVVALERIGRPLWDIAQALFGRDSFSNRTVRDTVTDTLANASTLTDKVPGKPINTDPIVDRIMGGPRVSDTIPGFVESTADRTGDAGLAALEYGRQSGPDAGVYAQRRSENTEAVNQAISANEPQGTPAALRSELALERDRQLTDASVHTRNAQDAVDRVAQTLHPAMTAEARGADIRTALEGASARAREILNRAWEPLNRSDQTVDIGPLAERFAGVDAGLSVAERQRFRPAEANIPAALAEEGGEQALNEVTGLRSALTDAAREARTAGRENEARIIDQHVRALDGYLDEAVPPALREQYEAARAATRDVADRFDRPQTAIAQTLDRQQGLYRQPDSGVASKFVQSDEGRIADFEALMREAGNEAGVQTAIRDQVLADVRDRRLLENPQALDEYLGRYNTLFTRFPQLRQELGNAAALRRNLDTATEAQADVTRRLGTADRPGTSAVGQYLRYGDERAEDALKGVIAAKEPGKAMDEILRFVNDDPAAVEGGRKAFWNLMQKRSRRGGETTAEIDGSQPWMPRAMKAFLDDPAVAAVAERLYRDNPEHLANIRKIADTLQTTDLRSRAKAPNTSGTAQGVNNVLTPETLQSRIYAYKRGQTSGGFLITSIAAVAARRLVRGAQATAIQRLLDEALLNPEIAAGLLRENNPANRAAMRKTAKGFLGNELSTVFDILDGEEAEKDPVKDAATR